LTEAILGVFAISGISILVLGGPLMVMISFFVAYSIGGAEFFGPSLILLWTALVLGFIFIMEKTGKARHFEHSDFPLARRLLAIPLLILLHKL